MNIYIFMIKLHYKVDYIYIYIKIKINEYTHAICIFINNEWY